MDHAWSATVILGLVTTLLLLRIIADSAMAMASLEGLLKDQEPVEKE